jgi:hypothetical protein
MRNKRAWWLVAAAGLAVVAGMVAAVFAFIPGVGASAGRTQHYGPIASTSPDSGTCGNDWAVDTFERHFSVDTRANANGTYSVTEQFKNGTFVTSAGFSPGGCQPGNTPATLAAGITGTMHGDFLIVVTGGTFNPNAVCTAATCGTTGAFVATVFGGGASYDVPTFAFHYNASNCGDWMNASTDRGGNRGDIACAA